MITALRCVHRDLRWADTAQVYDMGVLTERGDSLCRGCLPPPPPRSSSWLETQELSNAEQGSSILPA